MPNQSHSTDRIAELVVQLGRTSREYATQVDLTQAQWTCLRFFARANASTRTPSAFASFQATTRGTASQTIKALEARGLIAGQRSPEDGRSFRFMLTDAGRRHLKKDPAGDLKEVLNGWDEGTRETLLAALCDLSAALAERRDSRAFGTCADCAHFNPSQDSGYCACLASPLGADDIHKLCGSYCRAPSRGHPHDTA
jgi:DNA-binding MarR family transcriptional regulator